MEWGGGCSGEDREGVQGVCVRLYISLQLSPFLSFYLEGNSHSVKLAISYLKSGLLWWLSDKRIHLSIQETQV